MVNRTEHFIINHDECRCFHLTEQDIDVTGFYQASFTKEEVKRIRKAEIEFNEITTLIACRREKI